MEAQQLDVLNEQEDEVTHTSSEISQSIADLTKLVDSDDINSVSSYTSRNEEFRKMSFLLKVYLPVFSPPKIDTEQLFREFGSISAFSIAAEESIYPMSSTGSESSSSVRPLLDVPQIIATIDTGCTGLFDITGLSDEKIWTMGSWSSAGNFSIKLYNFKGELLFSFRISLVSYIASTKSEDLVFIDTTNGRSLNLCNIENKQVEEVIRFETWLPVNVCSTSSGDLYIIMMSSYDLKQTKVVRYSDFKEKQSNQFNDKGQPLYSYEPNKFLCENSNQDICVSDSEAGAVVVVNRNGRLRFTYNGPSSTASRSFCPYGITTDSQCRILTADSDDNCIHILDQDGHFLRYINNIDIDYPWGLWVDKKDNLLIGEFSSGKVKKIKFIM